MKDRSIGRKVLVLLLFAIALFLIMYPFVSNYLFEHRTASECNVINQEVEDVGSEKLADALEEARKYNRVVASGHVQLTDPFEGDIGHDEADNYEDLCNIQNNGVMGTIEIPVINVNLPIYHGTSDAVLNKGVGHLHGTSLPVGGEATHSVLTGHTGLSNAKLFTDLEKMEKGDVFFLHVLGETLAYEVYDINVVTPDNLTKLKVEPGKDYCTLLTCTPYGVNSHRLLVHGQRTEYKEAVKQVKKQDRVVPSKWMDEYKKALLIGFLILYVILLSSYVVSRVKALAVE